MDDLNLKQLTERIAAADREIAERQEKLQERKNALAAEGKTYANLEAETAKELVDSQKAIDALRDEALTMRDLANQEMASHSRAADVRERSQAFGGKSIAEVVFSAPEYKVLTADRLAGSSPIGALPGVPVMSREHLVAALERGGRGMFAAATADLDAGIPLDERLFPPVDILRRQIRLLDLITVGATDSDTVVYAQQTQRDSAAAETALGTAYSEAAFDFEQVTANVKDIGHFTTAYRSQIADAAQFDTLVRSQLQEDVLLRLESQVYAGNGSGDNLTGITATGSVDSVTRDVTNESRLDVIHRAMTRVRIAFREPDAILVHPNDMHDIVTEKANTAGTYLLPPDPRSGDPTRVWGLPIVVSPVATEGTGMVAYWKDATLWVRSGVSLAVSDSHSDYFTKRQVAILAEMRAAFSVQRPGVFCKVNLI